MYLCNIFVLWLLNYMQISSVQFYNLRFIATIACVVSRPKSIKIQDISSKFIIPCVSVQLQTSSKTTTNLDGMQHIRITLVLFTFTYFSFIASYNVRIDFFNFSQRTVANRMGILLGSSVYCCSEISF